MTLHYLSKFLEINYIHSCLLRSHIALNFGHASLQLNQLHVKSGLLAAQRSSLLLETTVLCLLVGLVSLHLLLHLEVLIGERLAHLLRLQSDHLLEGVLL